MIFKRFCEIIDNSFSGFKRAVGLFNLYGDTVAEHGIFLFIDLHERGRCGIGAKGLDGRISIFFRHPIVIIKESLAQIARQHDLLV